MCRASFQLKFNNGKVQKSLKYNLYKYAFINGLFVGKLISPGVPLLAQPVITIWRTWLEASSIM